MRIDRRTLLQAAGACVTAASLPPAALARGGLTLIDPTLSQSELREAGVTVGDSAREVQPDFIRQWRDGLHQEVARSDGATAYVRWDKALLLRDCARETGLKAQQRRLSRSVFAITIR